MEGIAPLNITLGTRWLSGVSFTARPLYPWVQPQLLTEFGGWVGPSTSLVV